MADQKGTGKHPHKSAREPYAHTKEQPSGRGQKSGNASGGRKPSSKSQSGSRKKAS